MNKNSKILGAFKAYLPPKFTTFDFVFMALLVAMNIVLERFIGFVGIASSYGISFITIIFAAAHYGPAGAVIVSCLGDVLGTLLSGRAIKR